MKTRENIATERSIKYRLVLTIIVLSVACFGIYGVSAALNRGVSLETEESAFSNECVSVVEDVSASAGGAIEFDCPPVSEEEFIHPGVVYTQSEIDSWSTSSPEYNRLAGTCAGTITAPSSGSCATRNPPVVYGTRIDCGGNGKDDDCELNLGLKDQSGFAKVQAVLWAADNDPARRDKVISYLQEFRTVTSFEDDSIEQWRLVAGWSCTQLAQAAEIIDYQDDQFKRFLRDVCYPILHWAINPNWHASFAESKLAIAAYLGDEELWTDAKLYFNERLKQSVYHSEYDGDEVNPIHYEDKSTEISPGVHIVPDRIHTDEGQPHRSLTKTHWGDNWGGQINDDYTLKSSLPIVDGINAERLRDLAHVNMSYGAWVSAARTIQAQGEQLEQHAYDRILTGWSYHADRVLAYLETGTVPDPSPLNAIEGGAQFKQGFFAAKAFLGADTPSSINDLLDRSEIKNFAAAGTLHMVGEAFTDGQ